MLQQQIGGRTCAGGRVSSARVGGGGTAQHQVVREHDAVAGLDGQDLVACVGVARDERERRRRPRVADRLVAMPDHEIAARRPRRQHHDEAPNHLVGLLGVLVRSEELSGLVDQHRVQLGRQRARLGQTQVAADQIEDRAQRGLPPSLIDPHPRPRNLPRVTDPPVEDRLFAVAVLRRTRDESQPLRLSGRYRELQRSDALDGESEIVGGRGSSRRERPTAAPIPQQRSELFARNTSHVVNLRRVRSALADRHAVTCCVARVRTRRPEGKIRRRPGSRSQASAMASAGGCE